MKKPSLIIGKKHIILACLTLILGIAIYLNYAFAQSGKGLSATDAVNGKLQTAESVSADLPPDSMDGAKAEGENYGDASYVNSPSSADYFAQARLDKAAKREEAVTTLQAMLGGGDLTNEEVAVMQNDAVEISKMVQSEGVVEDLVKAQGFADCVVYLDADSANIVVKSEGLEPAQAAQIKDILLSQVTVPAENITIFEVK